MGLPGVAEAQRKSIPDSLLSMFCHGFPFWKRGVWESLSHVVEQPATSRRPLAVALARILCWPKTALGFGFSILT